MILYKYVDENIAHILRDLELKLPLTTEVNDPFDSYPYFVITKQEDMAIRAMHQIYVQRQGYAKSLEAFIEEWRLEKIPQKKEWDAGVLQVRLRSVAEDTFVKENKKCCLLCVSKLKNNLLMWAHYANNHKGAVIGIDYAHVLNNGNGIKMAPVKYCHARAEIEIFNCFVHRDEFSQQINDASLTKSSDWCYEEEYRSPFPISEGPVELLRKECSGKASYFLPINPRSIKEVAVGYRADKRLRDKIVQLLRGRNDLRHVDLCAAKISASEFELEFHAL